MLPLHQVSVHDSIWNYLWNIKYFGESKSITALKWNLENLNCNPIWKEPNITFESFMDTLILCSTKDAFSVLNPCQITLFPPETNITDYFMADFEQRGELPALVCGASGKEITFAGKFQPKNTWSKLLSLRISCLQEWSLWAASLGRAYSTWAWTPETRWPCLRPIVQRWLHFAFTLRHWFLHMYYNFVKIFSTWPIIILF